MKINFLFLSIWCLLIFTACKRDDFSFKETSDNLRFSKDTIVLDTVYHQVRSETYAVKIYNAENKNITIPKIYLEKGKNSLFKINVDGKSGIDFENIPLRKNDSLYIFIEIAPKANGIKEFLAEDNIILQNKSKNQKINLRSVVQDAEFFIQKDSPKIINKNTYWQNDKVKVISGELILAEGKTLDIQEGTKIYFTKNSTLKISKNARLNINGSINKEVIFRGDRNDARYDTIPLNWKGIDIEENAITNINYAKIFGGDIGLNIYKATANIQNSIIHTFQQYGILAKNSNIHSENLVMNNCGQANIGLFGGILEINHSSIANYWQGSFGLPAYGILISNQWKNSNGNTENANVKLRIKNTILYGNGATSLHTNAISGFTIDYKIANSLLKLSPNFNFNNNPLITNSINNENPNFIFPYISKLNLRLKEKSPARGKALASSSKDIKGIPRGATPNMGAYE